MNLLTKDVGHSVEAEPLDEQQGAPDSIFTLLRTQLLLRYLPEDMRLIGVASAGRGEGKTYVAAQLAKAIAEVHPCVLVDLHVRRPDLSALFGLQNQVGVLDRLASGVPVLEQLSFKPNAPSLHVLPIGRHETASADMLFSDRMAELFSFLKTLPSQPLVLVDLPPILEGDDYLVISQHLDGQIMVVEEDVTSAHNFTEAMRLSAGVPLIGTILNKTDDLI